MSGSRDRNYNLSGGFMVALLGLCLLGLIVALAAVAVPDPPYSPDSWTYWDLAKSVFGSFYRIPGLRAYQSTLPWSQAFPPLWPALNAVVAAALGTGPITLLLTNVAVLALFGVAGAAASRAVFGSAIPGLVAGILLLTDVSFRTEFLAGRPIPLQMTFLAALIATLAAPPSPRRYALAGFLCGLMLTTKFDVMPLVAVMAAALLVTPGRRYLPLFLLAAAIPPLPWAWFSWTHFGRPFASDGSPIAAITDPLAFTTDFRLDWRPTLGDDPAAWLHKVALHAADLYWDFRKSWSPTEIVSIGGAGIVAAAGALRSWRTVVGPHWTLLVAVGLGLGAMLSSYVATGFFDARYYAPIRWFAAFLGFGLAWRALPAVLRDARSGAVAMAGFGIVLSVVVAAGLREESFGWRPLPAFEHPEAIAAITACLDRIAPTKLLFLDDDNLAARYAALTGRPTGMVPGNFERLGEGELAEFMSRFGFGAAVWRSPQGLARARRLSPTPIPGCDRAAQIGPARP